MRRYLLSLVAFAVVAIMGAAAANLSAQTTSQVPKTKVPKNVDRQRAAEIERIMRLRALQNRPSGGVQRGAPPIIMNGGPAFDPTAGQPAVQDGSQATGAKKTSAQKRAEARAKKEERKKEMRRLAAERKAEKARKAKEKKAKPEGAAA